MLLSLRLQPFVSLDNLNRDPAAIAIHPIYYGALSNIGVLFWSASAAVCLFSAYLLKHLSARIEHIRFLAVFGLFNTVLCLDDLFMLHEWLFPEKLYISENLVFLAYVIALVAIVVYFRQLMLSTQPLLFVLSILLFFTSIAIDVSPLSSYNANWIEDGAKFIAIFAWLAYFIEVAIQLARAAYLPAEPLRLNM